MPEAPGFGGYDSVFTFSKSMQEEMQKEYDAKWTDAQKKKPKKDDIIFKAPARLQRSSGSFHQFL